MVAKQSWVVTNGLPCKRIFEKKMLKKRKYWTGRGLIAAAKEEWEKIPLEMFQNALRAWPKRVHVVEKAKGQKVAL